MENRLTRRNWKSWIWFLSAYSGGILILGLVSWILKRFWKFLFTY